MAAKVIHFKKNGSSAPQKFVADDGGNNISAFLSSSRGAGTIFLPFYRHRAARKQYFCLFIVAAQRGNNIFAILSSPRGAGTIFLHFSACSAPTNTFPNGFGFCRPTASVQKCGENRARMAAGLMQRGK